MVNKTAWQRRIHFSASWWDSANTWQDEVPRDTCSDSSPLLLSGWRAGSAELYQELGGTERLLSFGRSELPEQLSHFALPALWLLPSYLGTGDVPNPQPFMDPCFHQQGSWSSSAPGHVPTWAGLHTKLSPALLGLHKAGVHLPQCLGGAAGESQVLPGGVCSSQSPLLDVLWGQTTPQKCHCSFTELLSSSCTPTEIPHLSQRASN